MDKIRKVREALDEVGRFLEITPDDVRWGSLASSMVSVTPALKPGDRFEEFRLAAYGRFDELHPGHTHEINWPECQRLVERVVARSYALQRELWMRRETARRAQEELTPA